MPRQDGTTVQYGYDGANRVTSILDSAISSTATTIGYDNASNATGMSLSNGAAVTKGYDPMERLTSVVNKTSGGSVISSYSYNYDADSDRTGVSESDGSIVDYGYDDLRRLTSEARTGTDPYNYSYTLDPAGNRTVWTDNTHNTSVSYTYDSANRLTAAGNYSYGYDPDGNRTSVTVGGNTTNYQFDYDDRLTGIGTSVSYSYIGAGTDRYSKTVSGTTTDFLYDNGNVDEEMQGTTVTADYGASAEKLNGTVSWMLQDGQRSTRQLLNSGQTVVASYISDAFGNSVGGSGSSTNPFIWNGGSGYYSDSESGLQKAGARYYDPAVGRWISHDTELVAGGAANSQAINRYAYCEGNPIGRWDPSGRMNPITGPKDRRDRIDHLLKIITAAQADYARAASELKMARNDLHNARNSRESGRAAERIRDARERMMYDGEVADVAREEMRSIGEESYDGANEAIQQAVEGSNGFTEKVYGSEGNSGDN